MDERSDKVIEETVDQIVKLFSPSRVIEYNTKYDMDGKLRSFKLCIVGKIQDKKKMLTQIFDEVDSEIPYDILLYTDEQFEELKDSSDAFASRVNQKGRLRYGKSKPNAQRKGQPPVLRLAGTFQSGFDCRKDSVGG